jgi:hypothetical protein
MTEQWRSSRWPPAAVGSHRALPAGCRQLLGGPATDTSPRGAEGGRIGSRGPAGAAAWAPATAPLHGGKPGGWSKPPPPGRERHRSGLIFADWARAPSTSHMRSAGKVGCSRTDNNEETSIHNFHTRKRCIRTRSTPTLPRRTGMLELCSQPKQRPKRFCAVSYSLVCLLVIAPHSTLQRWRAPAMQILPDIT